MIIFRNQALMPLLWLVLALIPLFIGEYFLRRRQEKQFLGGESGKSSLARDQWKRGIYLFCAALFVLAALLRPSWNPTVRIVEKEGRDVVFLLDVSRSMTASDVAPTRLERAKLEIAETVQIIDGDRVALVAFAGNSVVKCPLTTDYGFFSFVLDDISINSVSRGGSQLGDALRMVESQVFDDRTREERDIILITDGEDQESFPVEAAGALGEDGVRLIVIGLGDDMQGARVKDEEGNYLTYGGQEVWSRMNGDILRQMAAATPGGSYVPAGQSNFSLPGIYRSLIGRSAVKSAGEEETLVYEEKYQFFLAMGLFFLILEGFRLIGALRLMGRLSGRTLSFVLLLPLAGFLTTVPVSGEGRADLFLQGENALEAGDWTGFGEIYDRLASKGASEGKRSYNRGRSSYMQEDYAAAAGAFGEAAARMEGKQAARALYNRGNSLLKEAEKDPSSGANLTAQAREAYEKALEQDPRFADAARNLELLLKQNEDQQDQSGDSENQDGEGQSSDDQSDPGSSGQTGDQDQNQGQGDQNQQNPSDQPQNGNDESSQGQEETDSRARDILDQEESDREDRESTISVTGGLYDVEKDW